MRSLERVPHSLTKVAADTANADQAVGQKMGRPLGGERTAQSARRWEEARSSLAKGWG